MPKLLELPTIHPDNLQSLMSPTKQELQILPGLQGTSCDKSRILYLSLYMSQYYINRLLHSHCLHKLLEHVHITKRLRNFGPARKLPKGQMDCTIRSMLTENCAVVILKHCRVKFRTFLIKQSYGEYTFAALQVNSLD